MSDAAESELLREVCRLAHLDVGATPLLDWLMVEKGPYTVRPWAAARNVTNEAVSKNVEKVQAVQDNVVLYGDVNGPQDVNGDGGENGDS